MAALCLLSANLAADGRAAAPPDPRLQRLLTRFDEVQATIRTLSAELTMTTVNRLLKDPVVYHGQFFMTKPHSVRWEFDTPEEMRFVIAGDEYVGYFPQQRRAERKNIRRWSEQIFRYFGLGQRSDELRRSYHLSLEDPGPEMEGTHLLKMQPRKRRAKKRVEAVRFWISEETLLPVRVEYNGKNGSQRVVEFREMRLNPELARGLYSMELPADVRVSTGFTPLGADPGS